MKKLLLFLTVVLSFIAAKAQYVYKIKADSVLITNDSCTAELIIKNSTKNVKGFLVNKGNGRTEFRRAQQLTDSSFIVAGDTVVIRGTGSTAGLWMLDGSYNLLPKSFLGSRVQIDTNLLVKDTIFGGVLDINRTTRLRDTTRINSLLNIRDKNGDSTTNILLEVPATVRPVKPFFQIKDYNNDTVFEFRQQFKRLSPTSIITNLYFGRNAGANTPIDSAFRNIGIGYNALANNKAGSYNIAIGERAGQFTDSLSENVAIGYNALGTTGFNITTNAGGNTSVGSQSGVGFSKSWRNCYYGATAGRANVTTGIDSGVVAIGYGAGRVTNNGAGSKYNVLIGYLSGFNNPNVGNYKLWVSSNDNFTTFPLVYGEFNNNILATPGKFGIGTKTPSQALHVKGQIQIDTLATSSNSTDSIVVSNNGLLKKAPFGYGTYTPTITGASSSVTFPGGLMWTRIGDFVTVVGQANVSYAGDAGAGFNFNMTLPITSAFTQDYHAAGTAVDGTNSNDFGGQSVNLSIKAVPSSSTVNVAGVSGSNFTTGILEVSFRYKIL